MGISLRISFNLDDPVPACNSLLFLPPLLLPLLGTLKLMRLTMDFVRELPNPEQLTSRSDPLPNPPPHRRSPHHPRPADPQRGCPCRSKGQSGHQKGGNSRTANSMP